MRKLLYIVLFALAFSQIGMAGNPDRVGQAGASELLINPWARSSGWNGAFSAGIGGVEAMRFNPAGILNVPTTEFLFSRTTWLSGADIFINAFGFVQSVGSAESDAIGVSIMSFDFGDIQITTVDQPEGGLGTYSPTFTNIGLSYGHKFSDRIRTGITFRMISESIPNAQAKGFAIDAGLQYVTDIGGDEERQGTKFGISLRNVGTPMRFGGDGLARRGSFEESDITLTVDTRSAQFELPTLLNIGFSQDFYLDAKNDHRITFAGTFTSNSFTNDEIRVGLEYSLRNIILLRGGYTYEEGIFSKDTRKTIYNGPSVGASANIPFGQDKEKKFSVDYAYRFTDFFGGTHVFGARIVL